MNNKIKKILRIVIIFLALIEFIDKFIGVIYPKIDYFYYEENTDRYIVVDAYVKKSDSIILVPGKFEPFISIIKNQVVYEIKNIEYINNIFTYPEQNQSDHIKIAVDKSNKNNIKRCVPYILSENDKLDLLLTAIAISFFLLLYFINELYIKRNLCEKKVVAEISVSKEDIEKKEKIIKLCDWNIAKALLENNNKVMLGCDLHSNFIWCLENLSNCEQISDILLITKDGYGEYEFVTQTLNLREHGLPVDFYVVAKSSQYFLCGRGDSPRLYLFSDSLGITNTKYESIFDYIIENLKESV